MASEQVSTELLRGFSPLDGLKRDNLAALSRKVQLPSGGHLVIDQAEALTAIDVNTGRFTGKGRDVEQTILQTNLEAVREIAYQLQFRNIGGLIVLPRVYAARHAGQVFPGVTAAGIELGGLDESAALRRLAGAMPLFGGSIVLRDAVDGRTWELDAEELGIGIGANAHYPSIAQRQLKGKTVSYHTRQTQWDKSRLRLVPLVQLSAPAVKAGRLQSVFATVGDLLG